MSPTKKTADEALKQIHAIMDSYGPPDALGSLDSKTFLLEVDLREKGIHSCKTLAECVGTVKKEGSDKEKRDEYFLATEKTLEEFIMRSKAELSEIARSAGMNAVLAGRG